jgi:hypothetical protein
MEEIKKDQGETRASPRKDREETGKNWWQVRERLKENGGETVDIPERRVREPIEEYLLIDQGKRQQQLKWVFLRAGKAYVLYVRSTMRNELAAISFRLLLFFSSLVSSSSPFCEFFQFVVKFVHINLSIMKPLNTKLQISSSRVNEGYQFYVLHRVYTTYSIDNNEIQKIILHYPYTGYCGQFSSLLFFSFFFFSNEIGEINWSNSIAW